MRGSVMPARVTGTPVHSSAAEMSSTVEPLFTSRSKANAPVTCGAAIDVPLKTAVVVKPGGIDDWMFEPGASRRTLPA